MSNQPQKFTVTDADMQRAQLLLNEIQALVSQLGAAGGSVASDLTIPVNSMADWRAYAVLQHSGWGEVVADPNTGGKKFCYRAKGAVAGAVPRDLLKEGLKGDGFWDIFAKVQSKR